MKITLILKTLAIWLTCTAAIQAELIAHYSFDKGFKANKGPHLTSSEGATIDKQSYAVGGGALHLSASANGVVTQSRFSWKSDTRSIAFWVKSSTKQNVLATLISMGTSPGPQKRFDIRLDKQALRVEIQGDGFTGKAKFQPNKWYHVTVVVKDENATLEQTRYFIHNTKGKPISFGYFEGDLPIDTGEGFLRIGTSAQHGERSFQGHIDEVRLYNHALLKKDAELLASQFDSATNSVVIGTKKNHPAPTEETSLLGLGKLSIILVPRP